VHSVDRLRPFSFCYDYRTKRPAVTLYSCDSKWKKPDKNAQKARLILSQIHILAHPPIDSDFPDKKDAHAEPICSA
jgi:hypothetical protein